MTELTAYETFIKEQLRLGDEAVQRATQAHRKHAGELLLEVYVQMKDDDQFVSWLRRRFPTLPIKLARRYMQMALAAGYQPPPSRAHEQSSAQ